MDNYTRFVLTLIAVCLTINVLGQFNVVPRAYATEHLASNQDTQFALVPVSETNTIDVRIVDINTYDELNVNLEEVGGYWLPDGGPLKVRLD